MNESLKTGQNEIIAANPVNMIGYFLFIMHSDSFMSDN